MNKKLISALFVGTLLLGTTNVLTSCKDYDDDINDLQNQIDKLVTPETLNAKIAELQTAITEAKALTTSGDAALTTKLNDLQTKLDTYKSQLIELIAAKANQSDLDALNTKLENLKAEIVAVIGKRLTSITLQPTTYKNGIPCVLFTSLKYNAVTGVNAEGSLTRAEASTIVSSDKTSADFRLSPRLGIALEDIIADNMSMDCMSATNIMTRTTTKNSPISPVVGTASISDGVLTLNVKKTVATSIASSTSEDKTSETFWQGSLNVPIAKSHWVSGESETNMPSVNSEYFRIDETTSTPAIKRTASLGSEFDAHYTDSVKIYGSGISTDYSEINLEKALVSYTVAHDKAFDLKKVVDVCADGEANGSHNSIANYKNYGLTFRFAVASAPYLKGTNNTDEQMFAKIDSPINGSLTSKAYTINNQSYAAIGREPIIRVDLVDTVRNLTVDRKYIKIKFSDAQVPATTIQPDYMFTSEVLGCGDVVKTFGTQAMNENIYHYLNISKENFHTLYPNVPVITALTKTIGTTTTDLKAAAAGLVDGTDYKFEQIPDADNTTSYNLKWTMTPKAIGSIVPATAATYKVTVKWVPQNKSNGEVYMTFYYTVTVPSQTFAYQGTYWKDGLAPNGVFNVNPIVYNSATHGAVGTAGMQDMSHISANLINGYLNATTEKKPANVYELFTGFNANAKDCLSGVVIFDADRMPDYVTGYTVSADGTKLSSGTEVAAEIHNSFEASNADAYIHLMETGTDANYTGGAANNAATGVASAQALVGKTVPVKLVVAYNAYNKIVADKFDVKFITPITVDGTVSGELTDAVVNGSYVNVATGLTFTDWQGYTVAKATATGATGKAAYAAELYKYYGIANVVWDTDNAKTNLKLVNGVYTPTADYKLGNLPTGNSLKAFTYNETTKTYTAATSNPDALGYFNNNGTPVNVTYKLYVDVVITYKWGTIKKEAIEINVKPSSGI